MLRGALVAAASLALAGCGGAGARGSTVDMAPGGGAGGGSGGGGGAGGGLTASQKAMAEALTSIWENDTPILAYAYAENIHDGRGYTSGRAGFCTGTGDAIQVVRCYDELRPSNRMARYMPALTILDDRFRATGRPQADTAPLDAVGNWIADWGASDNDAGTRADFRACQDRISDLLYYGPAMQAATTRGLTTALSRAALYDLWINQGDDALPTKTDAALGVSGAIGVGNAVSEDQWLQKLLVLRRDLLAGDATWSTSVDRVAGYEKARRRGNWALSQPLDSAVKATQCWPGGGYKDSGYSSFVIQPDGSAGATTMPTGCQ